jgi:Polymer-forming cytoskeletal
LWQRRLFAGEQRTIRSIAIEEVGLSIFSNPKGDKGLNSPGNGVNPNTAPISSKTSPEVVSTLGPGMRVTGNIVCEGPLQIFGRIIGDIHASQLIIRESAQVEGNIIAHETAFRAILRAPSIVIVSSCRAKPRSAAKSTTSHWPLSKTCNSKGFRGGLKSRSNRHRVTQQRPIRRPSPMKFGPREMASSVTKACEPPCPAA